MKIKKGDYFDLYQDGEDTKRVIAIIDSYDNGYIENYCEGTTLDKTIYIDTDREIEKVIGNIFDD